MKHAARMFVAFAALLVPVLAARADYYEHGLGPAAGEVRSSLASPWEPGAWFAGTSLGVFRLAAGHDTWDLASTGLPPAIVTSLAAAPAQAGLLFAAVYGYPTGYGVYRSTDGGTSWIARTSGLGNLQVNALAGDPSAAGVLFAATEGGLYRTTNAGDTWQARGLAGKSARDVVIDPSDPLRAWASVAFEGIYRTTDAGASWDLASTGIGGSKLFYDIKAGSTGQILYAGGWDDYRSTNGGDSWAPMVIGDTTNELALSPGSDTDLFAATFGSGLFHSTDAGASWSEVGPSTPDLIEYQTVSTHPLSPGRLLAGALGGEIYMTSDGGGAWSYRTTGISTAPMLSLDFLGRRWLAGTVRGVYASEDWGRSFVKSDLVYDIGAEINGLAIVPGDGLTAFCGTTNGFFKGDVYRSTDGGRHWSLIKNGDGPVRAVVVDPANIQRVYAGYSCDVVPGGVYRSTNGRTNWITEAVGSTCVYALQIDPSNSAVVLAGTSSGVYRSTDFGDTWTARGPNGIPVVDLSADATQPSVFYAATFGARVHASTDGGLTWNPFGGTGVPANVYAVEGRDPFAGVLAGTEAGGLWRYAGGAWQRLPDDDQPPVSGIRALLADPGSGRFLAGTWGAGIWEYLSNPAGAPSEPSGAQAGGAITLTGSPSPGPFTIRLTRAAPGPVLIEVFDVAGRKVRAHGESQAPAGIVEWVWDGRDANGSPLPPAIYLVRARSDRGACAAKACLLR